MSAIFDVSLDLDQTLAMLGRVCVPELGALCVIDLIDDGAVRRTVIPHAEPHIGVVEECWPDATSTFPDLATLTRPALAEGRSTLVRGLVDVDAPLLDGEQGASLERRRSAISYMCAPLLTGSGVAGAVALVAAVGQRHYDHSDLALLDEIARRISLAMENARLLARARHATALRDDVLAVVSHDLRNPLAAVSMAIGRLEEMPALKGESPTRLLHVVRDSIDWMQHMIQDLLDVASIDAGRLSIEPRSMDPVILLVRAGVLFERLFTDQAIAFSLEIPESLPPVRVDDERILQVLGNLLSNAAKFTPADGQVTLSAQAGDQEVVVSVRDTGCGVPTGDVPNIFERFWHARHGAKTRGTGLGLSIAKGIVDAHAGRIWVDLPPAGGSVFSFALPTCR